jgi:uncharacterized protein (TIGR03435 family)
MQIMLRANLFVVLAAAAVLACATLVCANPNIAQNPPQTGTASPPQTETLPDWSDPELAKFVYSVVSIKPFKGDSNGGRSLGTRFSPDGYSAVFPVHGLIYEAYRTEHYRVIGGTGWMLSEMYSIEAKMDPDIMEALQKLSPRKQYLARQHMLQVLLRDYFKVVVRTEIRDVPAYDLVVAKKGPKLTQVADAGPLFHNFKRSMDGTVFSLTASGEPVNALVGLIESETGRRVADRTGLTGIYDFALKYTPKQFLLDSSTAGESAPLPAEAAPPIEKALEEQLGLRLASTTGQAEFIIIDSAERPITN